MGEHLSRETIEQVLKSQFYPSKWSSLKWEDFTEEDKKRHIDDFIKQSQEALENGSFTYIPMEKRQKRDEQNKEVNESPNRNVLTPQIEKTFEEEALSTFFPSMISHARTQFSGCPKLLKNNQISILFRCLLSQ
jgi:hypothetical protein